MDLDALKNLNVKDFLEKIKSGGGADLLKDKKTLIKFASVAGAILFFLLSIMLLSHLSLVPKKRGLM